MTRKDGFWLEKRDLQIFLYYIKMFILECKNEFPEFCWEICNFEFKRVLYKEFIDFTFSFVLLMPKLY